MSGTTSRIVIALIGIAILFIIFPMMLSATHNLQVEEVTTSANVTTGVGATTGNATLDYALWQADIDSVVSISSSNVTDTPAAQSYVEVTKILGVSGLSANVTRLLTVLYETDALTEFTGLGALVSIAPLLVFIGIVAMISGGIYLGARGVRGSRGGKALR